MRFSFFGIFIYPFCQAYKKSGKMDNMLESNCLFNGYFRTGYISFRIGLFENIHTFQH